MGTRQVGGHDAVPDLLPLQVGQLVHPQGALLLHAREVHARKGSPDSAVDRDVRSVDADVVLRPDVAEPPEAADGKQDKDAEDAHGAQRSTPGRGGDGGRGRVGCDVASLGDLCPAGRAAGEVGWRRLG